NCSVDPALERWAILNPTRESAGENPFNDVVVRPHRRRAVYISAYSDGRAAGDGCLCICRLGDCCGGYFPFGCSGIAGCACMVGALSEAGAFAVTAAVLDALDR